MCRRRMRGIIFEKIQDKDNKYDRTKVTMVSESLTLPEIFEDFRDFLRSCGFIIDGDIEIVNDETKGEEEV